MADDRHNRRDESRFKNRMLPRLSYKLKFDTYDLVSLVNSVCIRIPEINKDKAGLSILNILSILVILVILIQTNARTSEKAIRCRF
ncbi:hypothetical protein MTBBW1_1300027 [Desulfamplus magnetovallimortis]|uniref:Uncharacterized protein n=1 Tax=Desulfamplus magnetovallimortis TaxID=1246637 RepID=A0A1W1H752_9BACT|nr:hypothetical protein [Desulfamplus magnetovallimortis]SLM28287.1 hypothetical protein MTBBW1_1300027 [Desulfamplus magnetovallimortis]